MKKMEKSKVLLNVLCLEDELKDAELLNEMLVDAGYLVNMDIAKEEKEYLSFLKGRNYDLILADYTLPGFDVHAALKLALELQPEVPFICVSGTIGEDLAVELLKQGATDYVLKDRMSRLAFAVRRALEGVVNQKERKKAEEALRESEEKYRVLFEGNTLGILATDDETNRFLYSNPAICRMFGYSDEEFLRLTIPDLHPKDSVDLMISEFESRMRGEKVISSALPCLRKDGTVFYADISSNFTIINGRKCSVGFFVDVTMRKQAEDALRESKVKFQEIFESTGIATFIVEEDTTILMANNECYSIFERTPTELIGQKWDQYFASESLQEIMKNHYLRRQNPDLAPKKYEVKLVNKKGEKRDVILNISMISGTKQSIVSISDITELKRAEQAILQSEENFHRSISESPFGIRIISVDGKTIYANKAFLDIYEYNSLEEFRGMPVINRYTPESYAQHQERKEKRKKGHDVFDYEICIVRKNAEIRHVKVLRKEVLWNGIKHYQVINIDITEQKKLTIDLIAAKGKAEESDRLKTSFLHNISHEIRTPLNGLLGFLSILQDNDVDPGQRDEYIDIINKSTYRFMNTIDDIVEVSQIQAGQLKVAVSEINVHRLISELCCRYQPEAEFKGLKFFLKDELPLCFESIDTDENKLNGIISILLNNAIKFTKEGSIVFAIRVNNAVESIELEFSVKDTGVGIPEGKRQTIFERFMQVDSSDTRPFEGSGLGLSIAKAYVEMLGGKIWLESDPDGESGRSGSTFYFTIPYNTGPTERLCIENIVPFENTVNQINPNAPFLKILIVEDDEVSELFLKKAIKLFTKEILHAKTGAEAVEISQKTPDIDLILMDIKMSGTSGYEATRQIRQSNKKVIIIAQTAYGLIDDRQKAIESGCNDYIAKPINKDELLSLIQKYFKK